MQAPPKVELAAQFDSTRENSPSRDIARNDRLTALDSTGGAAWPFSVGRVIYLVSFARLIALSLVVHGRSSFVESLVWLFSRFCVHFENEERRREKKKREKREKKEREKEISRDQEKKRKREQEKKRVREKEKENKGKKGTFFPEKSQNPKNPPDELSHHDSKKKNSAGRNYLAFFLRKFRISPFFQLIP